MVSGTRSGKEQAAGSAQACRASPGAWTVPWGQHRASSFNAMENI